LVTMNAAKSVTTRFDLYPNWIYLPLVIR
jgi:hypothetical protein